MTPFFVSVSHFSFGCPPPWSHSVCLCAASIPLSVCVCVCVCVCVNVIPYPQCHTSPKVLVKDSDTVTPGLEVNQPSVSFHQRPGA